VTKPSRVKAVVLLSGGLDSTTSLYWALGRGYACEALAVDYGQRHGRELDAASRVAARARVRLHELTLALPWLDTSSLVNRRKALPNVPLSRIGRGSIPSTYVPGRNTVFLALAASLADAIGARAIVIGANALDYSGYPDCRPNYLRAFEKTARLGTTATRLKIEAPLLRLTKKGIVALARKVGAPVELTWSCYAGGKRPCGTCDSCKLRAKGFAESGLADPAL
jgi:7-cyano-7-deazaguanine synthase